ncbi:pseudouridine synthase [Glomus cerebriforme]|uniref:Pseudouridine synthase n=1 Tax=Glomus cerebriforme TaxID=658196 RepID=A0A397TNC8_9GLOM|nr:pseudouridine synthase [Glomus cerebriforme]
MRLDRYLHLQTKLPTSAIQKKIRKNESFSEKEIESIRSMIIYKDDEILAINKPQGLATQGGPKTLKHVDGLLHALQFDYPDPPRLVHRLDKNTTGVLILGRTRSAAGKLSHMFHESTMDKMYIAIVTKFLPRNLTYREIDVPLRYGGKPPFEKVTCMLDQGSSLIENCKSAITHYQVLAGTGDYALLRLYPKTGRKHQLRSHCAYVLKAPILGDDKYGLGKIDKVDTRLGTTFKPMYLHLNRLIINNWRTPEGKILTRPIEITAPLPSYFKKKSEEIFGIDAESD